MMGAKVQKETFENIRPVNTIKMPVPIQPNTQTDIGDTLFKILGAIKADAKKYPKPSNPIRRDVSKGLAPKSFSKLKDRLPTKRL